MSLPSDESVRYDIKIEAQAALKSLQELLRATKDNNDKIIQFSQTVIAQSKLWGVSWQQALNVYKQLNAELSKQKSPTLFGQTGGKNLMAGTEQYLQSLEQAGRLQTQVGTSANEMASGVEGGTRRMVRGLDAVRIALGAIVAMIVFQVIQAFQNFFGGAVKNAQELEAALYRIHNAERILSQEGIDITVKGLEEGIKRIKKLLPIFSKEDITGLVGQVAITTKSLKLTEDQIVDLSEAISVLNVNSAEEETLQQTAQKVLSSLLTDNAKGVSSLGIKLGDAALQTKGLELGFLQAGEAASALTDHEKALTKVAIVIGAGKDSIAGLNEFLDSNTAKIMSNKAAWEDLKTTVGQVILPFIPVATKFFSLLNDGFNSVKVALFILMTVLTSFLTVFRMVMSGNIKSLGEFQKALHDVGEEAKKIFAKQFFPEGLPDNAPQAVKELIGPYIKPPTETPTGVGTGLGEEDTKTQEKRIKAVQDAEKKIQDAMKDSADKKLDIERDYGRKLEDIARNYEEKLQDIARNTAEKREDALRAYNQKVEDINRDADQKIAEAKDDARRKEKDKEQEFLNRLRELREKFLFDLEDALRARDARQVLRLIRQYQMDKKNLEEKRKLDQQQSQVDLQRKLQDIERDRKLKLEAAKREYDDKLKDIAIGEARALAEAQIWRRRQLEDARLWHQRQLAEQREFLQRKLRDIADALKQELQMTSAGAQAATTILAASLAAQSALLAQFASGAMTPISANGAITGGSATSSFPNYSSTFSSLTSGHGYGLAEGGTLLATRPTRLNVAENEPEVVTAVPLSKLGQSMGSNIGGLSGQGMESSLSLRIMLSDGLMAEIVDTSLDRVATVIETVQREKS